MGLPYASGAAMDGQGQQQSGVGGYQVTAGEGGGYNSSYQPRGPSAAGAAAASSGSAVAGGSGTEESSAMHGGGADAAHSRSPAGGRGGMHGGYVSNRQQGTVAD